MVAFNLRLQLTNLLKIALAVGLWLSLWLVGPLYFAQAGQTGGTSTSLDNANSSLVDLKLLVGNEVQPYARLTVANKQSSQAVTLVVKPGTILTPNQDKEKYYDLVLVGAQYNLEPGKEVTLDLSAYLGNLGQGGKTAAGKAINFNVQALDNNAASKTAAEVLGRATQRNRTAGDNAVQLGLWMALGNLSFEELSKFFTADIGSFKPDAEFFRGSATSATTAIATTTSAATTVAATTGATTTGSATAAVPTVAPTPGNSVGLINSDTGNNTTLILLIGTGVIVLLLIAILVVVLIKNNRDKEQLIAALQQPKDAQVRVEQGQSLPPYGQPNLNINPARPNQPYNQPPINQVSRPYIPPVGGIPQVQGKYSLQQGDTEYGDDFDPNGNKAEAGRTIRVNEQRNNGKRPDQAPPPASPDDDPANTDDVLNLSPNALNSPQALVEERKGTVLLKVENNKEYEEKLKLAGRNGGFEIDPTSSRVILSRGSLHILELRHPTISAPHAILEFRDKQDRLQLYITDLNSANGTFVLNHPLQDTDLLKSEGRISPKRRDFKLVPDENGLVRLRFGSARFIYYWRDKKLVSEGDRGGQQTFDLSRANRWIISRSKIPVVELSVKRGNERLYDGDTRISTPHALLQLTNSAIEIRDLNSRNGVFLEGEQEISREKGRRIGEKSVPLRLGDGFQLGDSVFRLYDTRVELQNLVHESELKDYAIDETPLGGGMGLVYRCKHKQEQKYYALKIPRPEKVHSKDQYRRSFNEEKSIMQQINSSPNAYQYGIVSAKKWGEIKQLGVSYYIMDYIDGVTLREIINTQGLIPGLTPYIIAELLNALGFVHANLGLAHCDVSSGNVMIDRDGKIWLTDFGIATRINEKAPQFLNKQYAAPELSSKVGLRFVNQATDIFSVGMLIYHLSESSTGLPQELMDEPNTQDAMGRPRSELMDVPQRAETVNQEQQESYPAQTGQNSGPTAVATPIIRPDTGGEITKLKDIRRKCLKSEQSQRYQTVSALLEDLNRLNLIGDREAIRKNLVQLVYSIKPQKDPSLH